MVNVDLGTIEVKKNNADTPPANPNPVNPTKNKMGLWDWMNAIGTGMSLFGTSVIDPVKGTALTQEVIKENKKKDIQDVYKDWQATTEFNIWQKAKQGQKLEQWEKDFADIKDPNAPPPEIDLWKQAEKETLSSLGGSSMMGLSRDKQAQYYPAIENRFLELKKQFNLQTPDDRVKRARRTLRDKGFVDSPDAVGVFLKNNPNF